MLILQEPIQIAAAKKSPRPQKVIKTKRVAEQPPESESDDSIQEPVVQLPKPKKPTRKHENVEDKPKRHYTTRNQSDDEKTGQAEQMQQIKR